MPVFHRDEFEHSVGIVVTLKDNFHNLAGPVGRTGMFVIEITLMGFVLFLGIVLAVCVLPGIQFQGDLGLGDGLQRYHDRRFLLTVWNGFPLELTQPRDSGVLMACFARPFGFGANAELVRAPVTFRATRAGNIESDFGLSNHELPFISQLAGFGIVRKNPTGHLQYH